MSARQDLLDELVAERHRPVPPPGRPPAPSADAVALLEDELFAADAECARLRIEVESLHELVARLERNALEHHCRPLRAVS